MRKGSAACQAPVWTPRDSIRTAVRKMQRRAGAPRPAAAFSVGRSESRGVETGLATPSRARAVSAEENGMQLREAAVF